VIIVLLSVLYDTGQRVVPRTLLTLEAFVTSIWMHRHSSAYVAKDGVSGCALCCHNRLKLVRKFLCHTRHATHRLAERPLLQNAARDAVGATTGARITILLKVLAPSRQVNAQPGAPAISPHTFRHTKGMHLLQSGVAAVMVKDFLGHVDSSEIHPEVMFRRGSRNEAQGLSPQLGPQPTQPAEALSSGLIEWLESL